MLGRSAELVVLDSRQKLVVLGSRPKLVLVLPGNRLGVVLSSGSKGLVAFGPLLNPLASLALSPKLSVLLSS